MNKREPNQNKNGFYRKTSEDGKMSPDYDALLKHFESTHHYKSIAGMGEIYVFNGSHYEPFTPVEVKAFAESNFFPKPSERVRNEFYNKVLVNNIAYRNFFTETIEEKINFKNGVLELRGPGLLKPHSPKYGFRGTLPYNYDKKADCPKFENWLSEVLKNDRDLISILQEFMGYTVRGGEYKFHKALWLEGRGRNGKSTFIDIFKSLIGSGNYSTVSIKNLIHDKFAAAELDGKTANFSEETSPKELTESGPFKNLTGDGDMQAQKKYGNLYSFRNRAKVVMTYNQIPDLKDLSHGMLSRPLIVPFKKTISEAEQDHNLKDTLYKELPGIFNFALRGWKRLNSQNHFTESDASTNALLNVKQESCNVFQWIESYVSFGEEDSKSETPSRNLYEAYKRRERYAFSYVEFGRRAKEHPGMKNRHKHTKNGSVYRGVNILENTNSYPAPHLSYHQ